jgi:hypothetical protein
MTTLLDNFYLQQNEPYRGCMLALRDIVLKQDAAITQQWKYGMPFFCYKGKMFCYFWTKKATREFYIGFVEGKHLNHPELVAGDRSRIKILPIDPKGDLPVALIVDIIYHAIGLYKMGIIKTKKV